MEILSMERMKRKRRDNDGKYVCEKWSEKKEKGKYAPIKEEV